MGRSKRTTRSGGRGNRTTVTRTITNSGKTKITRSTSSGSKHRRFTSSTDLTGNSGTKHYVTTTFDGWRKTTLLNPKPKKPKKPRPIKYPKSKPMKLGTIGWIIVFIMILGLLAE